MTFITQLRLIMELAYCKVKNMKSLFVGLLSIAFIYTQAQDVIIEKIQGIPNTARISEIKTTSDNTIWMVSDQGLYNIASNDTIANLVDQRACQAIYETTRDGIWVVFQNKSLEAIDNQVSIQLNGSEQNVTSLCIKGAIAWVGSDTGISTYHIRNQKSLKNYNSRNSRLENNQINFIHQDIRDKIWIGTDNGLAVFEDRDWKNLYDKKLKFFTIDENNEGKWVISDQEMYLIHIENGKDRWQELGLEKDLYQGIINDLSIDTQGKLYIASDVLVRLDPYSGKVDTYSEDVALLSKKCLSIELDYNNQLWIGTDGNGFYRLRFADNEAQRLTASCIIEETPKCIDTKDGIIKVSATGGTKPYKYTWNTSGLRGNNPKRLAPGKYTVTVTDANGISTIANTTLEAPNPLVIDIEEIKRMSGPRKKDGKISLKVTGGQAPYTYKWSTGEVTNEANNLPAGNHSLTVTDVNGCKEEAMAFIPKEKFIPELESTTIEVGQTLRINELYFEADSSVVTENSFEVLDEIFQFLQSNNGVVIEIGGHTNNVPPAEYCDQLSTSRAKNIAYYFYDKGISTDRISYKGYGKRNPIASNNSVAGRRKNQRVELKILAINE